MSLLPAETLGRKHNFADSLGRKQEIADTLGGIPVRRKSRQVAKNDGLVYTLCAFRFGWLVDCFGFNGSLRQYSVYIRPSPKERENEESKDR